MSDENNKDKPAYHHYAINQQSWAGYETDVEARASIACLSDRLLLEFIVAEPFIQARYRHANGEVHQDSCVEFFIRFDDDENYYNIELNVLGNMKFAYGKGRNNRVNTNSALIDLIKRQVFFKPFQQKDTLLIEWKMEVVLPFSLFQYHHLEPFESHRAFGNFYKCGDGYNKPHYLSWLPIKSDQPDFHRPEYFGLLFDPKP